jgi:hypothetical protein
LGFFFVGSAPLSDLSSPAIDYFPLSPKHSGGSLYRSTAERP